jgi:hypothetical protein
VVTTSARIIAFKGPSALTAQLVGSIRRIPDPAPFCRVPLAESKHKRTWLGSCSGAQSKAVWSSCAPATEYVAMPDGSSSAAPVKTPGPSDFNSNRIQRAGAMVGTKESEHKSPASDRANPLTILHGVPYEPSAQSGPVPGRLSV